MIAAGMKNVSLATVGAVCAVLTTVTFVVGIGLLAGSGVETLIPEPGQAGLDWIADVNDASGAFFVGGWLLNLGGVFVLVAWIGFYDALKGAGPALILAPILGAVSMTLVTVSHLIPLAMAYELAPGYADATPAAQESLAVTADTLSLVSLVTNYFGNALGWGVVVPLYAYAIMKTGAVPRWIGWLGWFVAVFAGWLSLLGPASTLIEGVTFLGFVGFFVFMASMGVALLRRRGAVEAGPAAVR